MVRGLREYQNNNRIKNDELLGKIKDFYKENGRIPLKTEFNSRRIYRDRFGSWNNAIKLSGYDPNPILYAKRHIAKDGHLCDSLSEKIIDDWLSRRGIKHSRNMPYPGDSK